MIETRLVVAALFVSAECTCNKSEPAASSSEPPRTSPAPAALAPSAVPASAGTSELAPSSWLVPSGLRLSILAGKGVGPIRFGATVATIERLMDLPCEVKTEEACRYIARAIDFELKDGAVVRMHIHRRDRSAGVDGRTYGIFNGRTPEGVAFHMLPSGVEELIGKPQKILKVDEPGPWNLVEVREYPGMRLEFDRIANGNTVLGGIVLTKADVK